MNNYIVLAKAQSAYAQRANVKEGFFLGKITFKLHSESHL